MSPSRSTPSVWIPKEKTLDENLCQFWVKNRRGPGRQCGRRPARGLIVCSHHAKKLDQDPDLQERQADVSARQYGYPLRISPHEALLREVHRCAGNVAHAEEKVRGGDDEWLVLYLEERRRLVEVSKTAILCGIEERRIQLAEDQARALVAVIRGVLADLRLSPEQERRAPLIVRRQLTAAHALVGGPPEGEKIEDDWDET